MSDSTLRDAVVLGDLCNGIAREVLHAVQNLGGTLAELRTFMATEHRKEKVFETLAREIIGAPVWEIADKKFLLDVDFDTDDASFLAGNPIATCTLKRFVDMDMLKKPPSNEWSPAKPGWRRRHYALYHPGKSLTVDQLGLLARSEFDERYTEHAGWRELYSFMRHLDGMDLKGYGFIALGATYKRNGRSYAPMVTGGRDVGNCLNFTWDPRMMKGHPGNRCFVLLRKNSSSIEG